jgi:hypothetical protein
MRLGQSAHLGPAAQADGSGVPAPWAQLCRQQTGRRTSESLWRRLRSKRRDRFGQPMGAPQVDPLHPRQLKEAPSAQWAASRKS